MARQKNEKLYLYVVSKELAERTGFSLTFAMVVNIGSDMNPKEVRPIDLEAAVDEQITAALDAFVKRRDLWNASQRGS
jgi:hypothetical protein